METIQADIPNEIQIGAFRVVLVHPDMVRLWNEDTAEAVTVKVWELQDVLQMVVDTR
jgi:hypothetical protein